MHEEPPKLIQPREHKAKVTVWGDLSVTDMDRIDEVTSADQVKAELADIFHIESYQEDLKAGILLDLYYYTIQYSRDNNFTKEQTSTFFSIIKRTHEVCIETPFGNVEQAFNYFREMVLCHAVKRPPFSIDLFTAEEVRKITDYTINTYFRHYKMYKYVFTPLVRLDLSMTYTGMPPSPPPSESGDGAAAEGDDGEEKADAEKSAEEGSEEQAEKPTDGSVTDATSAAPTIQVNPGQKTTGDVDTNPKTGSRTYSKKNLKVASSSSLRAGSSSNLQAASPRGAGQAGKTGGSDHGKAKEKDKKAENLMPPVKDRISLLSRDDHNSTEEPAPKTTSLQRAPAHRDQPKR